jgi:hypothetical protein
MRPLLLALAAVHLGLAAWMAFAPDSFAQDVAGYPPQEPHFLGDLATWTAALGAAFAVAAERPSWRMPILGFAAIQYALHTLNHIWDAGETDPAAVGPLNAVLLAIGTGLLVWLARRPEAQA